MCFCSDCLIAAVKWVLLLLITDEETEGQNMKELVGG